MLTLAQQVLSIACRAACAQTHVCPNIYVPGCGGSHVFLPVVSSAVVDAGADLALTLSAQIRSHAATWLTRACLHRHVFACACNLTPEIPGQSFA